MKRKDNKKHESGDSALMDLLRAIVSGERDRVSQLLAESPSLAVQALGIGASRKSPAPYFFWKIAHYVYAGDTPLQSAAPQDLSIQDSIPRRAGERVILFNKRLEADWVVALTNLPYEETRPKIRDLIDQAFGIASENEIKARVDVNRPFERRPQEPLFGDGAIDFHAIGVPVSEGREWRIQTKPYNKSWRNNYSQSGWRIIDGGRLFAKACSLIVVSRIDRSREWVVMHPGIPLPFTASGETRLVTDSEIKAVSGNK